MSAVSKAERAARAAAVAARKQAREAFASSRGWKVAVRPFTLAQLKRGSMRKARGDDWSHFWSVECDHPDYMTLRGRPVAVVGHSYSTWQTCRAFAALHGLHAERLLRSWYRISCTAVCFTLPVKP